MQGACAILLYVARPALQYISTLSHKHYDFRKTVTEHELCFDILYNFCLKYLPFLKELSEK